MAARAMQLLLLWRFLGSCSLQGAGFLLSAVSAALVLNSVLPKLYELPSSPYSFDSSFFVGLTQLWWPMAGLWLPCFVLFYGIYLWARRKQFESSDVRDLSFAAVPIVYGLLFALMATLSRSSWGDAMLYRQSYVTPIGMIAIGLLLISLKLSAISANRWLVYCRLPVLILPAGHLRPPAQQGIRIP